MDVGRRGLVWMKASTEIDVCLLHVHICIFHVTLAGNISLHRMVCHIVSETKIFKRLLDDSRKRSSFTKIFIRHLIRGHVFVSKRPTATESIRKNTIL